MVPVRQNRTEAVIDGVRLRAFVSDPERTAARLEGATRTQPDDPDGLPVVRGYIGTLRATLLADQLRIRGSLPAYLGHSAPLPRSLLAVARERIEDALDADLGDAHVWSLEVTADLVLPRPVGVYLPLLLRSSRLRRAEYERETVSFKTRDRAFTFYDKAEQCRKVGLPIPRGHVLRAELKYHRRLARQIGAAGPLSFADLHTAAWMERLVGLWRDEYDRVEKARAPVAFDALADVRRSLAHVGLGVVGMESVEAAVRAERDSERISRSTMHDRLRWLRDLAADPALTAEDERVGELDAAVYEAVQRAVASPAEKKDCLTEETPA